MNEDKEKLWKNVLDVLRISISEASFKTYLLNTRIVDIKEIGTRAIVEIGCDSFFIKQQVEQRYYGLIQEALTKEIGKETDLTFTIKPIHQNKREESVSPLFENSKPTDKRQIEEAVKKSNLRSLFTFDKFAVSGSNQLAHAAAEAVSKSPGNTYNPLFIWGGVGVGKSHLMHAVGHQMIIKDINSKIIACTAEDFTNDIVEGIRNKTTAEVRKKYRQLNALFIDDIQFIAGKDTAQEEFFHTFNAVTSAGGQVILTSDRPPTEISKLEDRLKTRFEAGLIVDIAPPDFELRSAIVQIKAEERGIILNNEMVALIAGNVDSARGIQGFLVRLFTEVNFNKKEVNMELIQSLLGKSEEGINQLKIKANPDELIGKIAKYYSLNKRDLLGESRQRSVARPRQILMYLLKTHIGLPLQEVGRLIGGRDHTTVMHAVDKIQNLLSSDVNIQEDIKGIKNSI